MSIEIDRKLEYADRTALQQADQTIKKDVVRAIVELVTNSDDSYRRMEQKNCVQDQTFGLIRVCIRRRHEAGSVSVSDCAEGMTPERMDKCVGKYAEETSGANEGMTVRGFFGRGLKEAILGLGEGAVRSVSDGRFTHASIAIDREAPRYKREKAIRATKAIRNQLGLSSEKGTTVEIIINRTGVRIPQISNLRTRIERHFALREILSNPKRKLILVELDSRGRDKREFRLDYRSPVGEQIHKETVDIPGYPGANLEIEVFRSASPLEGPALDRESAEGGFIVKSSRAVLDLTIFRFEHDPGAERLFGKISCDFIDTLLARGEPLVKADRTGIDWSHDFAKALKRAAESFLQPIVDAERDALKESRREAATRELKEKIASALPELNKIAQAELGRTVPGEEPEIPFVPEGGFGFVPDYAQVLAGKQAMVLLRALESDTRKAGIMVEISSESEMVLVHTEQVVLERDPNHSSILSAKVIIEGRQVGAESIITAATSDSRAEAFVQVISKRKPIEEHEPQRNPGLFQGFRFDELADPHYRARFEGGTIVVAVSAPSVSPYIGPGGTGSRETPQGQVMLAELAAEAVCREIARQGVAKGRFISLQGAETDAIQREYIRLQNQYTARIHELFVDAINRNQAGARKLGRPPREARLIRSTVPA